MSDMESGRQLFGKINKHLLADEAPSEFLRQITKEPEFRQPPYDMLLKMKATEQSPKHHPEGNVWTHTLMVVDEAAKHKSQSKNPEAFMWAALLHDIGKPVATRRRKGKITSYSHDKVGARLAGEFLSALTDNEKLINAVVPLVRYHMQILFVAKGMAFADVKGMKRETDIQEIALLGLCDRLGRGECNEKAERENIRIFLEKCEKFS